MPSQTRSTASLEMRYPESRKVLPIIAKTVGYDGQLLSSRTSEEYIDRSLITLAKKIDQNATKQDLQELELRMIKRLDRSDEITHERLTSFRSEMNVKCEGLRSEMNGKFEGLRSEMNGKFSEMNGKLSEMNGKFETSDKRFNRLDGQIQGLHVQISNSTAVQANGRLHRLHQPINLIKVLKYDPATNQLTWKSHPRFPKNMKRLYDLGHHAQGIFDRNWNTRTDIEKRTAEREARNTIEKLAEFYEVSISTDDQGESDATEMMLDSSTIEEYMEALSDAWGIDSHKVVSLVRQYYSTQVSVQQAGIKRLADIGTTEAEKRTRPGK